MKSADWLSLSVLHGMCAGFLRPGTPFSLLFTLITCEKCVAGGKKSFLMRAAELGALSTSPKTFISAKKRLEGARDQSQAQPL